MTKTNFKHLALCSLMIAMFSIRSIAQDAFNINNDKSTLTIIGTSSIHDWEMAAQKITCESTIQITDNSISSIENIAFKLPVNGIKSDNKIMDSKTHKALNEKKFPEISFKLAPDAKFKINETNAHFSGLLTIAGETKEISVACNISVAANNSLKVKGEIPVKMSNYNIAPPTAMMGALKTGDDVVIKFDFELNK